MVKNMDDRKRSIENRVITLEEEIKLHVLLWKNDHQFKHLNKFVKDSIEKILEAIETADSIKKAETVAFDTSKDIKNTNSNKFIAIFKSKYMELTDYECEEKVTEVKYIIIRKAVEKIMFEESNVTEYLNWVFDDFLRRPENQTFNPPSVGTVVSNFVLNKYLFEKKEDLRVRKKDAEENEKKLALVKIASEVYELCQDKDVAEMIVKFSKHAVTITKFKEYLMDICERSHYDAQLTKIKEVK